MASELLDWIKKEGASVTNVDIHSFNGLRGLRATQDIQSGDVLINVPWKLVVSKDSIPNTILSQFATALSEENEWVSLLLIIFFESARSNDSFWKLFWAVQPSSFDMPLWWTPEELNLLRGSYCYSRTMIESDKMSNDFQIMFQWISSNFPPQFLDQFKSFLTLRHWTFCASVALSRGFSVSLPRGNDVREQVSVVVPFVDMINHQEGDKVNVKSNVEACDLQYSFQILATKEIKQGEQIFLNYNESPNYYLLLNYGFVLDENEQDAFPFEITLEESIQSGMCPNEKILNDHKVTLSHQQVFNSKDKIPSDLLAFASMWLSDSIEKANQYVAQVNENEESEQKNEKEEQMQETEKENTNTTDSTTSTTLPNNAGHEYLLKGVNKLLKQTQTLIIHPKTFDFLMILVKQKQKKYETTIEQDLNELRKQNVGWREWLAIRQRWSEKTYLNWFVQNIDYLKKSTELKYEFG